MAQPTWCRPVATEAPSRKKSRLAACARAFVEATGCRAGRGDLFPMSGLHTVGNALIVPKTRPALIN